MPSADEVGPERVNALANELRETEGILVELPTSGADALALIGLLQLALRHPDVAGQAAEAAEIAKRFVRELADAIGPETRRLVEESW